MKMETKFNKLIDEYDSLKDELMDHEGNLHDAMFYDIQGYCESYEEILYDEDGFKDKEELEYILKDLEKQVKACRQLLKAYEKIEYVYC